MPSLAVTRKGIYTDGLDGKISRKEERFFFGLVPLRTGIIVHDIVFLLVLAKTGLTNTREELSMSYLPDILNIYVPIPFIDRGITSSTMYLIATPLIGLYGAYNRSRRAMKVSWMVSYGEVLFLAGNSMVTFDLVFHLFPRFATNEYIVEFAKEFELSPDNLTTFLKFTSILFTTFVFAVTAVETRMLYAKRRYEKFLAPVEEEENAYSCCAFCEIYY